MVCMGVFNISLYYIMSDSVLKASINCTFTIKLLSIRINNKWQGAEIDEDISILGHTNIPFFGRIIVFLFFFNQRLRTTSPRLHFWPH
jgi:hypothetical protein